MVLSEPTWRLTAERTATFDSSRWHAVCSSPVGTLFSRHMAATASSKPAGTSLRLGDRLQRVQIVEQAQVALDRAFGIGFGQAQEAHRAVGRRSLGHGVDVGRGPAHVDQQQLAEPGCARAVPSARSFAASSTAAGVGMMTSAIMPSSPADALGLGDAGDEQVADLGVGRVDLEHADLGHDVGGVDDVLARTGEQRVDVVVGRLVAGHDDVGHARRRPGEHGGVVGDHLLVAAVGAAGEQHDVGSDLLRSPAVRPRTARTSTSRRSWPRLPERPCRPASVVYSGTRPTQTTRRPPAALLQATVCRRSASPMGTVSASSEKASSRPTVMSWPTVDGTCTRARSSSASRSKATSLVKVLPKSTKSRMLAHDGRPARAARARRTLTGARRA